MKKFSPDQINKFIDMLDFSKVEGGLVPVIAQDHETNTVLMLAFANEEAVRQSLEIGLALLIGGALHWSVVLFMG